MELRLRPGTVADAAACGRIRCEAFRSIAAQHNVPPDFPSAEAATDVVRMLLTPPGVGAAVAAAPAVLRRSPPGGRARRWRRPAGAASP
jgi:hypothetical protein